MLGCSYDSLVQREKARRMKRISAMIALCLLLAASFTGMLFAKNQELTRKNQQLTEAIELSLRREADLLVKKAEDALQSGDIAAAMQFAGNALYSADIQRPYSPPGGAPAFFHPGCAWGGSGSSPAVPGCAHPPRPRGNDGLHH